MSKDLGTQYRQIKTKQEYINFYKIKKVANQYAKNDFKGLTPLITIAETSVVLNICKTNKSKMGSLLDLATGSARILSVLEKHFTNSVGIDSSPLMLKAAKKRLKVAKLKIADIEKLPFKKNLFDVVTGFRFIINVPKKNRALMLSEISRVLKKDGLVIINLHHNKISPLGIRDIITKKRSPKKTLSIFGIKAEFKKVGLNVIDFKGVNVALLSHLLPFASMKLILTIDSTLASLYPISIFSETIILAAKKI